MRAFRSGVLVALVLVSAVVVVASPAFATPRLTTSTSAGPVSARPDTGVGVAPFFTPPSADSRQLIINESYVSGRGSSFVATGKDGGRVGVTCSTLQGNANVLSTHTRIRVSRLTFSECKVDGLGFAATVETTSRTANPHHLHLRSRRTTESWDGTFNISTIIRITVAAINCRLNVRSQSVDITDTNALRQIEVRDSSVGFTSSPGALSNACPDGGRVAEQTAVTAIGYRDAAGTFRSSETSP